MAQQADVVSISIAANSQTAGLIDEGFFNALKPAAYFVNTSRGSVVDYRALSDAIQQKGVRAGLDVFANEPGGAVAEFTDPIIGLPGVYGSHHVGASTDQAQLAIADEAVRIVKVFIESGEVCHCVNLASRTPATCLLTVRHLNKPGVLAHVFDVIGAAQINVEEMENIIYDGAEAACAKIQLDDELSQSHIDTIRQNPNVLSIDFSRLET